jgi:integrase
MSARSVRYLHSIVSAALKAAVAGGQLAVNPAARASAPTARQARAPEIACWTAAELAQFLAWSAENSPHHAKWHVLAMTGMRRGELLALRWRDIELDRGKITVRRSAAPVREHGQKGVIIEGPPKSGKPRVVAIDPATVAVLRTWKAERGSKALALAKPDAIVFGGLDGEHLSPERLTRNFGQDVARCRKVHPDLPVITLHGLRHTHVSIQLQSGVAVKTVSARVGHSTPIVTMTVYAHLLEGDDEAAAGSFAATISAASREVANQYHEPSTAGASGEVQARDLRQ